VTGLEYLHEHGVVHGDLKGVSPWFGIKLVALMLIMATRQDHQQRWRNEGTTRWMAPELMNPEEFGFSDELLKRLPSTSTDIYAIGVTILEVSASLYLLKY